MFTSAEKTPLSFVCLPNRVINTDEERPDSSFGAADMNMGEVGISSASSNSSKRLYLIHVNASQAELANLEGLLQAQLSVYIPHNTFLSLLNGEQAKNALSVSGIVWIGPYLPSDKLVFNLPEIKDLYRVPLAELQDKSKIRTSLVLDPKEISGAGSKEQQVKEVENMLNQKAAMYSEGLGAFLTSYVGEERAEVIVTAQPAVASSTWENCLGRDWCDFYSVVYVVPKALDAISMQWLADQHHVVKVEPVLKAKKQNYNANWVIQSGTKDYFPVYDHGLNGEGQLIGIADSGLDYDNCFFRDSQQNVTFNSTNPNHRKILGYFSVGNADLLDDPSGHGTHVAGTLAGELEGVDIDIVSSVFIEKYHGIAYRSKLVFLDISAQGAQEFDIPDDLYTSSFFRLSYDLGVRVHSNSWTCSGTYMDCNFYSTWSYSIDRLLWEHQDLLVVFAAGNFGEDGFSTIASPANCKNCISVGASGNDYQESWENIYQYWDIDLAANDVCYAYEQEYCPDRAQSCCIPTPEYCCQHLDANSCCLPRLQHTVNTSADYLNRFSLASFSSKGPASTISKRIKPDVVAPGFSVVSAHSDGDPYSNQCSPIPPRLGNNAALMALFGTSMATPVVSGAAVLIRQYFAEGYYPSGERNSADAITDPPAPLIKAMLISSAVDLTGVYTPSNASAKLEPIPPSPSYAQGFGKVQLDQVLYFKSNPSSSKMYASYNRTIGTGVSHIYSFLVNNYLPLKVVMVYHDFPVTIDSALVNDVDLQVETPSGLLLWGNDVDGGDDINNVERVVTNATHTEIGVWKVRVKGINIRMGPQYYAITVSSRASYDYLSVIEEP